MQGPLSLPQYPPLRQRLLRALTLGKAILYGAYGINFLFFSTKSSIVQQGGVLASPVVWGLGFGITSCLLMASLLRPHIAWIYQLSQMAVVGVTSAWIVVRIVIVIQNHGLDFVAPIIWGFVLLVSIIRILIARASGAAFDTALVNSLDDVLSRWRRRLPPRHRQEVS